MRVSRQLMIAWKRCVLLLIAAVSPIFAGDRIGAIDFYGYKGIDVARLRAKLPVHTGDPHSPKTNDAIRQVVLRLRRRGSASGVSH